MLLEAAPKLFVSSAALAVAVDVDSEGPGQKLSRTTGHAQSPSTPRLGADGCSRRVLLSRPVFPTLSVRKLLRGFRVIPI